MLSLVPNVNQKSVISERQQEQVMNMLLYFLLVRNAHIVSECK